MRRIRPEGMESPSTPVKLSVTTTLAATSLAESHLDNKMQSCGDKTRVVCSRGRSRTLRARVSHARELHHSPPSHPVLSHPRSITVCA